MWTCFGKWMTVDCFTWNFKQTENPAYTDFSCTTRVWQNSIKERIRTVILYHGNVKEAPEELNIGTAQYRVENVFLGRFDGDAALDAVERHLNTHEWTPEDRWRLALAMNMRFTKRSREEAVESVLRLVHSIAAQQERDFVVAGILSLTERVLTESERIRVKKGAGSSESDSKGNSRGHKAPNCEGAFAGGFRCPESSEAYRIGDRGSE